MGESKRTKTILIVNGYGCQLVPVLVGYLDGVCAFMQSNVVDLMILCGGQTQRKTFPGVSEAQLMLDYIKGNIAPTLIPDDVVLLEDTYWTFENIVAAAKAINDREGVLNPDDARMTIFCEAQRSLTVQIVAYQYLGKYWGRIKFKTVSWELRDPKKELDTADNVLRAIRYPRFADLMRIEKIRLSEER